ncbi:MAG TPA: DUF4190 domain-containing protein [Anaerolineales bacterium]|nr:DUF4190 domain-containing protein [Anaerolineales bacterium]
MSNSKIIKHQVKTPVLAYVAFGLGILAMLPMAVMTVDFIIPKAFAAAVAKMPSAAQTSLLLFNMLGSLPFSIAALVTGIIAFRKIRNDRYLKGERWAILAIVLGCLGLIFGIFLYLHFVSSLNPNPPTPT